MQPHLVEIKDFQTQESIVIDMTASLSTQMATFSIVLCHSQNSKARAIWL